MSFEKHDGQCGWLATRGLVLDAAKQSRVHQLAVSIVLAVVAMEATIAIAMEKAVVMAILQLLQKNLNL